MAFNNNGMNISYDYEELLEDLTKDVEDGVISPEDIILILRDKDTDLGGTGIHPIIDYYYLEDAEALKKPLENLYNREEYTKKEWADLERENKEALERYKADEPYLVKATVSAVLTEMEMWNSIF